MKKFNKVHVTSGDSDFTAIVPQMDEGNTLRWLEGRGYPIPYTSPSKVSVVGEIKAGIKRDVLYDYITIKGLPEIRIPSGECHRLEDFKFRFDLGLDKRWRLLAYGVFALYEGYIQVKFTEGEAHLEVHGQHRWMLMREPVFKKVSKGYMTLLDGGRAVFLMEEPHLFFDKRFKIKYARPDVIVFEESVDGISFYKF